MTLATDETLEVEIIRVVGDQVWVRFSGTEQEGTLQLIDNPDWPAIAQSLIGGKVKVRVCKPD